MKQANNFVKFIENTISVSVRYIAAIALFMPAICFADDNPLTTGSTQFASILFGVFGTTLCSIIIGATFIMAKVGKVSWDRFLFIGFCSLGFLGAPSIVMLLKSWVGGY